MSSRNTIVTGRLDYVLVSLFAALLLIGWLMIYVVGYKQGYTHDFSEFMLKTAVGKQTIFIGLAILLIMIIFSTHEKFWRVFAYPIYSVGLSLLFLVLIFGKNIKGAKAWFSIGGFGFQPVEIAKLGTILALASYLTAPSTSLKDRKTLLTVAGLILAPMALIILQPDAGSMLVFFSFAIMLYREGLSATPYILVISTAIVMILGLVIAPDELALYFMIATSFILVFNIKEYQQWYLAVLTGVVLLAASLFYDGKNISALVIMITVVFGLTVMHSLRGRFRLVTVCVGGMALAILLAFAANAAFVHVFSNHQKDLINVWLRPDKYGARGIAYNLNHSKMAISSGGFQGKGFLEGTMTRLNFVPEQQTDFIFVTVGEEQGFIGVLGVILIFAGLLVRIIYVAERQRSNFVLLYGYGLAGILFTHFFINIGMTMGLTPVIGIPLPFISSGGSSLMGFTAMLAIFLKMDSER